MVHLVPLDGVGDHAVVGLVRELRRVDADHHQDVRVAFLEQPELYRLWRSLGRGEIAQPSTPIRDQLHARWAITDRTHTRFLTQAANDPNMEVAFESPGAVVLRIKG